MNLKQNDWAAVLLNVENNETVDLGENPMQTLYEHGITPDNTGLQDEDYYKSIPQVIDRFTKDGEFDEKSYKSFYDSTLRLYNEFTEIPFVENMLDDIGVTSYDSSRLYNSDANVKNFSTVLSPLHDKNRSTHGTANIWENGSQTFSDREVAQANFVRDENGNVLDWKPNDRTLFRSLFDPALIYAKYEDDVYDEDGRLIHQKGELKLDKNGDPYTELIGNRPAYGQDIVNWTDTITVDGSFWNKLDFLDSDGLDKDLWKIVAKTATEMGLFFTPAGKALGWAHAAIGLTTALPSLVKSLNSLITNDSSESPFMKSMTTLENIMGRFKPTTSDASRGRFFSAENIGDLLISSSAQLFSQRNIANALHNAQLFKDPAKNKKFAEVMSIGYMASTSTSDVFGEMKQAGADDWLAGIGSLLSLGGFYTLLSHGYFKDRLFQGSLLDEDQKTLHSLKELTKQAIDITFGTNTAKEAVEEGSKKVVKKLSKEGIAKAWTVVKDGLKKIMQGSSYGANAYLSRSINEGLEETSEEIMIDAVKWLAKSAEYIGIPVSEDNKELNFGRTLGNTLERWGTSFVGGFLGGAVFELHNQVEMAKDPGYLKWRSSAPIKQIYQYVARGEADHLRDIIRKRGRKGRNGNSNLSASFKPVTGADGEVQKVYGVGTETDNQNLAITNALLDIVNNAESIYKQHNMIWSNEDLIKKVLGTKTMSDFMSETGMDKSDLKLEDYSGNQSVADAIVEAILDLKDEDGTPIGETITMNVLYDINGIRQNIIDLEQKIALENRKTEDSDNKKRPEYLKKLIEQRDDLVEQFNSLINGNSADNLLTQILLFFDDNPLKNYLGLGSSKIDTDQSINNIERYSELILGITYDENTNPELKAFVEDSYDDFKKKGADKFRSIAKLHLDLSDNMRLELETANKELSDVIVNDKYIHNHQRRTISQMIDILKQENDILLMAQVQYEKNGIDMNDPKYEQLIIEHSKIKRQLAYFNNLITANGDMSLDQWFDYDLDLTEEDTDATLTMKQNMILQFYIDANENKALFTDDQMLMSYLRQLKIDGLLSNINALSSYVFENNAEENKYYNWKNSPGALGNFEAFWTGQADESVTDTDLPQVVDTTTIPNLQDKLIDFVNSFRGSASNMFKTYDDLIRWMDLNLDYTETARIKLGKNAEEIIKNSLNPLGTNDLVSFINQVRSYLEGVKPNQIHDWLQKVHSILFGSPSKIFDIIKRERTSLYNRGLSEYLLGEAAKKELENAAAIVNIIHSLIEASANGNLNEIINSKRKGYKNSDGSNKEEFTILDDNAKEVLTYELQFIYSQIESLMKIAKDNEGNKTKEDEMIAKVDSVSKYTSWTSPKDGTFEYIIKNILNNSGFDYEGKSYDKSNVKGWSGESYDSFVKEEFAFKKELHKWFSNLSKDKQKSILSEIAKAAKDFPDLLNMKMDEFTDKVEDIGLWGNLRYLLANLTSDIEKFNQSFYTVIDSQDNYIPFYGQEFIIRDAYATFYNKDLYNHFINELKNQFVEKYKTNKTGDNLWAAKIQAINNFLFIDGVPGSGKTTAVAGIFSKILKHELGNDIAIISLTHTDDKNRISDFGNAVGSNENHRFLFSDFINRYINPNVNNAKKANDGSDHSESFNGNNNVPYEKLEEIIGDTKHILIISDEQTFANEAQLLAFSNYTSSNDFSNRNIYLLGLGDLFQSGTNIEEADITDTFFQSSVRLTTTFRAENEGKSRNERIMRNALNGGIKTWSGDRSGVNVKKIGEGVYNVLQQQFAVDSGKFIGYTDVNGKIYGDVAISNDEIINTIYKLKNIQIDGNPARIAIITDDESKYASHADGDQIVIQTPKKAQGGQWDYVIVDTDMQFNLGSNNLFGALKEFYTIMTRAKHGTAWNQNRINFIQFQNNSSAMNTVGRDLKENSAGRENYVKWRKHIFEILNVKSSESSESSQESISSESDSATTEGGTGNTAGTGSESPEVQEIKNGLSTSLYTGMSKDDMNFYRTKNYDEADPKADENKSRKFMIEQYKKRRDKINSGDAFNDDVFYEFIENEDNLKFDCFGYDISNHQTYVEFLYRINASLMDMLLHNEKSIDFDTFINRVTELRNISALTPLINLIINDKNPQLTIKKKGESIIVYYEFEGGVIPISALVNNDVTNKLINTSYKLDQVKTNVLTGMIPISSNGEKFLTPRDLVRKNINFSNKVLIFKGYSQNEIDNGSATFANDEVKEWHKNNKGKAFIVVGRKDHPPINLDFNSWPQLLNVQVGENNGVSYFIDKDGWMYMRLIGVQRACTVNAMMSIMGLVRDAAFAKTLEEYHEKCNEIKIATGIGNNIHIRNKLINKIKAENGEESLRDLFTHQTWEYLQTMLVGLGTNPSDSSFAHLISWLAPRNVKEFENAISFSIPDKPNSWITVYRKGDVLKIHANSLEKDVILDLGDNNVFSGISARDSIATIVYLALSQLDENGFKNRIKNILLKQAIEQKDNVTKQLCNKSDVTLLDLIKKSFEVGPNFGLNVNFMYYHTGNDNDIKFIHTDPSRIFLPTTNDDSNGKNSIWDTMISKSGRFSKDRVNMPITASEHGSGKERVFGTVYWQDGMGFDIVEIIPASYSFKLYDTTKSKHKYHGDTDNEGIIHPVNKAYDNKNGNIIFVDKPKVDASWLNIHGLQDIANGEWWINQITADDKIELVNIDQNQFKTVENASTSWRGEYTQRNWFFGQFKRDNNNILTYNDKPFTFVGSDENRTYCIILTDGKFEKIENLNDSIINNIDTSRDEIIYNTNEYVIKKSNKDYILVRTDGINIITEPLMLNRIDGVVKINSWFDYTDEVKSILSAHSDNDADLILKKNLLKGVVNQIKRICKNSKLKIDSIAIDELFEEMLLSIDSASKFEMETTRLAINSELEKHAYNLYTLYQIGSDYNVQKNSDPYNLAREVVVDEGYKIISISSENGIFSVYLSNETETKVKRYQNINGEYQEILNEVSIDNVASMLESEGVDTDLIESLKNSYIDTDINTWNKIVEVLNGLNLSDNIYDAIDALFEKLC